jgi:hypothetical protein
MPGARVTRQDGFQPHQDRRGDIGAWHQACLVQSGDGWDFPNWDGCLGGGGSKGAGASTMPHDAADLSDWETATGW